MSRSVRSCDRRPDAGAQFADRVADRRVDGRERPEQRHQPGHRDRAGADVAHVGAVDPVGLAVGRHPRVVEAELREIGADRRLRHQHREQRDERHPREHAARHHDARDARPDDVADAEVLRRDLARERGVLVGARRPGRQDPRHLPPQREQLVRHGVDERRPEPGEHGLGHLAAALAGDEHLGAGRALGIGELAVLLDDERAPHRHHHQHADDAAHRGEGHDLEDVEVFLGPAVGDEEERGDREDDAGGDRLAGRADRLDDVVLEDGGLAEPLEDRDRQDRDRDRGRDGEARRGARGRR